MTKMIFKINYYKVYGNFEQQQQQKAKQKQKYMYVHNVSGPANKNAILL